MIPGRTRFRAPALLLASTLCLGPVVVSADYEHQQAESRMSERDQRSWERYLEDNEQVARRLSQNPELIRDRQFVRDYESLEEWLHDHPRADEALQADPQRYVRDENDTRMSSSQSATFMNERDLSSFERFLDSNPETAQRLYENPDLINDRQFTRSHEALDNWLDSHSQAAATLQANPHKFLWRERSVNAADFLQQLLR